MLIHFKFKNNLYYFKNLIINDYFNLIFDKKLNKFSFNFEFNDFLTNNFNKNNKNNLIINFENFEKFFNINYNNDLLLLNFIKKLF